MAHGRSDGPVFLGFLHLVSSAGSGTAGLVYPSFPDWGFALRRSGRFLRCIWWRTRPGRHSPHHERFPYRELRCAGIDIVLPALVLAFGILACACYSLGAVRGRPFLQVCMQFHALVPSVRPKRRRKQGQGSLYPHEPFGVDSQYCRRIVALAAFTSFLLGNAVLSMCTFHWIGLAAQATFRRIHRRLLWCTFPFV